VEERDLLRQLSDVLEQLSKTSSKLQKRTLLATYLQGLSDDDLAIAATFLRGSPFPAGDGRALHVGWSTLIDALLEVSGVSSDALGPRYLEHGDLGSVAAEFLEHKAHRALLQSPLTLRSVADAFARMAEAKGKGTRQIKLSVMRELFAQAEPLEAKYLVRIITSDMRVGLKEGLLEEAIAQAFGVPLADVRRASMLLSDVGKVAVLARAGRLEDAKLRLFSPIGFMLAEPITSAEEAFPVTRENGGEAAPVVLRVEDKYDGVRAQIHSDGQRVAIFSRTLDEVTNSFPELLPALRVPGHRYIIDGEIVAWRDDHAMPFLHLQQRLRRKDPTALLETVPVILFVFDLLHLDGEDLLDLPLSHRLDQLTRLQFAGPLVEVPLATTAIEPAALVNRFRAARDRGNEGLVIKSLDAPYLPGRRGRLWLKWKEELATLDVVIVAAEHGHGKRAGVLSDVTFSVRAGDGLATIGKAYSGLTDEEIEAMTQWFRAHTIVDRGRVKVVEPRIVLEVAFDAITRSDRHSSGYALRFPRIKRIRDDKTPEQASTIDDVAQIFEYQGRSRGGAAPPMSPRPRAGNVEARRNRANREA